MNPWQLRAQRARFLAEGFRETREILSFYAGLAEWQGRVAPELSSFAKVSSVFPSLLEHVRVAAPPTLAQAARDIDPDTAEAWLRDYWETQTGDPLRTFFARAALQPYAANLPDGLDCPGCTRPPQAGCLHKQGDGLAFAVVCSLCLRRRPFPRTRCPNCNSTSDASIASYSAPDFPHLRLMACEECRGFLVVIDLEQDPAAIPEVDEMAALPLDLWAIERGYHKLQPNFAGV